MASSSDCAPAVPEVPQGSELRAQGVYPIRFEYEGRRCGMRGVLTIRVRARRGAEAWRKGESAARRICSQRGWRYLGHRIL